MGVFFFYKSDGLNDLACLSQACSNRTRVIRIVLDWVSNMNETGQIVLDAALSLHACAFQSSVSA